uniref:Lipid-binding serum glycoprotein C-terminal domain-containing protein n=1 Tax=Ditylenchus dipsaci TaxID=166011 RepID=A0A915DTF3_9BILA
MSAALFDHYFINYGLIGPIVYSSEGAVEMRHRGNVFGRTRLNDFRLPFRSSPLMLQEATTEPKNMVTFQFSNYTLSSLLFWMDQYRKFDFEISKQSVNDSSIAGYLRTECGPKDICAGTLFPALAQSFSNGLVNIKTHTVTYPHVRLEQGKAYVILDSRIDAFVSQPDRNRRFLTASMLAELTLTKPTFKDYTFKAQLVIDSFKISDVVSLVEGIDAGSIEFLINALNELIIAEDILKKLKDGIKLPILLDFDQSHSEVHFEKDRMWIGADYCFDEQCKRAAANSTNEKGGKLGQSQDMDVNYYDAAG